MTLPPVLKTVFLDDIDTFEKEKEMPVITPTERGWLNEGIEQGRLEGRRDGLRALLRFRFKQSGLDLMPRVEAVTDHAVLDRLFDALETVPSVETFAALLPPQQA